MSLHKKYHYRGYEITLTLDLAREVIKGRVYDPASKQWLSYLETEGPFPQQLLDKLKTKIIRRDNMYDQFQAFKGSLDD